MLRPAHTGRLRFNSSCRFCHAQPSRAPFAAPVPLFPNCPPSGPCYCQRTSTANRVTCPLLTPSVPAALSRPFSPCRLWLLSVGLFQKVSTPMWCANQRSDGGTEQQGPQNRARRARPADRATARPPRHRPRVEAAVPSAAARPRLQPSSGHPPLSVFALQQGRRNWHVRPLLLHGKMAGRRFRAASAAQQHVRPPAGSVAFLPAPASGCVPCCLPACSCCLPPPPFGAAVCCSVCCFLSAAGCSFLGGSGSASTPASGSTTAGKKPTRLCVLSTHK